MILSRLENGKIIRREIDAPSFDLTCQVLCVGAGGAGINAADSAAREGADVILCEFGENIGGMHVCGNVTTYYYGARGGSYVRDDKRSDRDTVFLANRRQPEQRQIRLIERLKKSGVRLMCCVKPIGLYFEGERVLGMLAYSGDRFISIRANITVDATSDGHLIRMTDVKKQYGKPSDGSFVPFGVIVQYTKDGKLYWKNNDSGITNHYSAADFSEKTIMAHAAVSELVSDGEIVNLALHTGIREGLTFEGEDAVRYEDALFERRPKKILFYAYADLDRHGSERATEDEEFRNWWVVANLATVAINIPVPMGSIVPKSIKGLVSAGRCICCDTYSQSAVRMNSDMFRMGECVGVAAAMSALSGKDLLDIDYEDYRSRVTKRGCFNGNGDKTFYFDNSYLHYLNKMRSLGLDPDPKHANLSPHDHIREPIDFDLEGSFHLLKTDTPGIAIWSCYRAKNRDDVRERLYHEMESTENRAYRYNCSIALGLLVDSRALTALREIVQNRDCFFFKDNRRSNQFRSAVAVCLLGRLGEKEDLPLLLDILSDKEIDRPMYHTLKANYLYHSVPDRNFVYFHMLTHTCMAIYEIYKRTGLPLTELHSFFESLFSDGKILRRVTDTHPGEAAYEEMNGFIGYVLRITAES